MDPNPSSNQRAKDVEFALELAAKQRARPNPSRDGGSCHPWWVVVLADEVIRLRGAHETTAGAAIVATARAIESQLTPDQERILFLRNTMDALGGIDIHERAMDYATHGHRSEPDDLDYYQAVCDAIDSCRDGNGSLIPSAQKAAPEPSPVSGVLDFKVTVCSECLCASCWQGSFFCDNYRNASTTIKTVRELKALGPLESPDYWFKSSDTGKVNQQMLDAYRSAVNGTEK